MYIVCALVDALGCLKCVARELVAATLLYFSRAIDRPKAYVFTHICSYVSVYVLYILLICIHTYMYFFLTVAVAVSSVAFHLTQPFFWHSRMPMVLAQTFENVHTYLLVFAFLCIFI